MWPPLTTRQLYPHTTFSTADITPDLDICVTIDTAKNKSVDKLASFDSWPGVASFTPFRGSGSFSPYQGVRHTPTSLWHAFRRSYVV